MSTPEHTVLIKLYCTHQHFFYVDYFKKFKLFVAWYLQEEVGEFPILKDSLPWYRRNYEVQELAKILKVSEQEVLELLENTNV